MTIFHPFPGFSKSQDSLPSPEKAKAASMFDKVVASMGLTEYAKLVGPSLDTQMYLKFNNSELNS